MSFLGRYASGVMVEMVQFLEMENRNMCDVGVWEEDCGESMW